MSKKNILNNGTHDRQEKIPLKVCFVSYSSGMSGGAERTLPRFVHSLQMKGVKVHVILPSNGPMVEELEKRNIKYIILPYRTWMHLKASLFKKIAIFFWNLIISIPICLKIIQWNCNIVFSNTITVSIGALAAKLTFRTHIWHIREFGYEDHGFSFDLGDKFSYWLIKRLSNVYIFISFAVEEKYKEILPLHKRKVVYEGYITSEQMNDNRKSLSLNNQDTIIRCLMIGTLHEGKGHKDAIKSIGELKKDGIDLVLDIVGEGFDYYKKQLLSLISQYKLGNNVFFHGYIDDPFSIIKNCDIFLMCSKKEAFGFVTIEAMQFGKPVIGTKSGGTKELIVDGFNGLFYSPGDYIELAKKIKYLVNNPYISKKMGENGKKWVFEKFTFERYVSEMIEILQQSEYKS